MGWILNQFAKRQAKEAKEFANQLKSMDADEIGLVVAVAAHMRNQFKELYGVDLLFPAFAIEQDASLPIKFNSLIKDYQKQNKFSDAAAAMVWLHTLRSFNDSKVRNSVREVWRQLQRGFPHGEVKADFVSEHFGIDMDIEGFDLFPDGLTPDPK
jgi:hypothetical protein